MSEESLKGQTALVTGGGRGLGRTYALALAEAGAAVALVGRTAARLEEAVTAIAAMGGRARAYAGDVTDAAAMTRVVAAVERELGPIDLLVNAAGTAEPLGPIAENDPDEWWRGLEVNVRGPFVLLRLVLPGMIARGRGRIVNVSSGVGTRAYPNLSSYSVGKTALIRLTECAAAEAGPHGVRVFSISPGMVRTDMNRALLAHPKAAEYFPWAAEAVAQGRDVKPEVSARLVLRLARGEGDALSGRHLSVADDLERLVGRAADAVEQQALLLRLAPLR
ncbi:MAG TPA: SDR family oxidoreductase [Thermoanaerobaculia bacterium]|nr:SDR family oxidoreductase [Thermoanaerobaculia bacterium]